MWGHQSLLIVVSLLNLPNLKTISLSWRHDMSSLLSPSFRRHCVSLSYEYASLIFTISLRLFLTLLSSPNPSSNDHDSFPQMIFPWIIPDCDETFNYWEPLYQLLRPHAGEGLQTWEYAPEYALRTHAFLLPLHFVQSSLVRLGNGRYPPNAIFSILKILLIVFTATCEHAFVRGLRRVYGRNVAIWTYVSSAACTGMGLAGSAYLPSSISMALCMLSWSYAIGDGLAPCPPRAPVIQSSLFSGHIWIPVAASAMWFYIAASPTSIGPIIPVVLSLGAMLHFVAALIVERRTFASPYRRAVLVGLIAVTFTGWPFVAVIFIPLGIAAVTDAATSGGGGAGTWRVGCVLASVTCRAIGFVCLGTALDSILYDRITSATWNILVYNAFGSGDDLYGIEPTSYYFKNLFLNFNGLAVLMAVWPVVAFFRLVFDKCLKVSRKEKNNLGSTISWKTITLLSPMYFWLAIMGSRPHKEERFLYPVYPLVLLASSLSISEGLHIIMSILNRLMLQKKCYSATDSTKNLTIWQRCPPLLVGLVPVILCAASSLSRTIALHRYYAAPTILYSRLRDRILRENIRTHRDGDSPVNVCVGGQWHTFPASYLLLEGTTSLRFLQSGFGGQLPAPFSNSGFREGGSPTRPFNNINRKEISRFFRGGISACDYVVELMLDPIIGEREAPEMMRYMMEDTQAEWKEVEAVPYLDGKQSVAWRRTGLVPGAFGGGGLEWSRYSAFKRSPFSEKEFSQTMAK